MRLNFLDNLTGHTKRRPAKRTTIPRKRGPARTDLGWHTFEVQKAYCTPASGIIKQALETYGISRYEISKERVVVKDKNNAKLRRIERAEFEAGREVGIAQTCATEATVKVPRQQAEWAEYLMERTGRLVVVKGRINPSNREWADKHGGAMPRPWIEDGCVVRRGNHGR